MQSSEPGIGGGGGGGGAPPITSSKFHAKHDHILQNQAKIPGIGGGGGISASEISILPRERCKLKKWQTG